jgi:hypothetical protein
VRWLVAFRNILDHLFPAPPPDLRVVPRRESPVEFYQRKQREQANAWQEVDR